jgi:hypothetical protein
MHYILNVLQIPKEIVLAITAICDGAQFFSVQYGFFDCLRGFNPENQDIDAPFPVPKLFSSGVCHDLLVNDPAGDFSVTKRCIQQLEEYFKDNSSVTNLQSLAMLSMLWAADSLQGQMMSRLRIVKLRIRCLSAIVCARISADTLSKYLSTESILLRDLLALSDMSAQRCADLMLENRQQIMISEVALDCSLVILKCGLRRRGPYLQIGIDKLLGLVKAPANMDLSDGIGGSHDTLWVSIILAACSAAQNSLRSGLPLSQLSKSIAADKCLSLYVDRIEADATGVQYLRNALEYFATALSAPESYSVSADTTPLIGALVYFLRNTQSYVLTLFDSPTESISASSFKKSLLAEADKQLMWTISKSLACLDLGYEEQEYQSILRSSDIIGVVAALLEQFSGKDIVMSSDSGIAAKSVIENALSLLTHSLNRSRRSLGNASDSGIQLLYRPFFPRLCGQVFESSAIDNEYLWFHVLNLISAGISVEPTFLAQFLRAPYANSLKKVLMRVNDAGIDDEFSFGRFMSINADLLLIPLAKLAHELCITADGQAFMKESGIIGVIISSFVSPMLVLPKSPGISTDTANKCGRYLTQILRDYPQFKEIIKKQFQALFIDLCNEAKAIGQSLTSAKDVSMESDRMKVLQRLTNLFSLVEHLGVDGRRQSGDAVRDILTRDIIEVLVSSFDCTLPPGRQLLAQLGTRQYYSTYVGYSPSVKALISMLKVVTHVAPHVLLPVLLANIDEILQEIGQSRLALIGNAPSGPGSENADVNNGVLKDGDESENGHPVLLDDPAAERSFRRPDSSQKKTQKKSHIDWSQDFVKDNAGAPSPVSVHVLNILDSIPHQCMFASQFDDLTQPQTESIMMFLKLTMKLEWVTEMTCYCVRVLSRMSSTTPINLPINKDTLRRLFAFQRSSVLEICRFATSRMKPAVSFVM